MHDTYDTLETRSADEREAALAEQLPRQIAAAQALPGYAALSEVVAEDITDRMALDGLPVLRKSDLMARQAEAAGPERFRRRLVFAMSDR